MPPPARLNRALLGVLGVLALAAGAFGLAFGLRLLDGRVPGLDPTAPLLPPDLTLAGWAPWAATAGAVLLGLACLRWLLAQTRRRPRSRTWQLGTSGGTTTLPAAAAAAAIENDISSYPGIGSVTATLAGPRDAPALHLDVTTEAGASVSGLRGRITTEALPRVQAALDLPQLRTSVVLRVDSPVRRGGSGEKTT